MTPGASSTPGEEPHNLDAERSVLGCCLVHPDAVPLVAALLRPSDLYLPRHQLILQAVISCHSRNGVVDVIAVSEELQHRERINAVGGHAALLDLCECIVPAAAVDYHCEIIAGKARQRRLIAKCREIAARARNGEDAADLVAELQQANEFESGARAATLPLLSLGDLGAMGQRKQLVDGLIFADSLNAFCGQQKSFKTVIADALCVAVAEGGEFLGRKVLQPGLVIDFALEGMEGKAARYRAHLGVARFGDITDPVHRRLFLHGIAPDITTAAGQDLVLRTIEEWQKRTGEPLRLTKWDTVARAMSVARLDENSTQDMGAWIAGLDRIRSRIPHAQCLVHHNGRNGMERGSTALPGAVDLLAFVEKTDPCEARFKVRDARDIEVPSPLLVRFAPVVVGEYPNGKPVTAMRIDSFTETVRKATDTKNKPSAREALLELANETGIEGFDFATAMQATGCARSTTSEALGKMVGSDLEEFHTDDGGKRWRRRVR